MSNLNISVTDMRLLVLTTDTPHHRYFLIQLVKNKLIRELIVIFETNHMEYRYQTSCLLDREISSYENGIWADLVLNAQVIYTESVNNLEITRLGCFDFVINFGTGKLDSRAVREYSGISQAPILNLHGGNLEEYRGLDTNLWAIWHKDYKNICVTIHELVDELDAGSVWLVNQIDTKDITPVNLREYVTYACVDLVEKLLAAQNIVPQKVKKLGRYYSAMPAALKTDLLNRMKRRLL